LPPKKERAGETEFNSQHPESIMKIKLIIFDLFGPPIGIREMEWCE
jgi:hypothetical protein